MTDQNGERHHDKEHQGYAKECFVDVPLDEKEFFPRIGLTSGLVSLVSTFKSW